MTMTDTTAAPAHHTAAPVPAVRVRISTTIEDERTTATLERLAASTDPRTSRELKLAWR